MSLFKTRTKQAKDHFLLPSNFIEIMANHKKFLESGVEGGRWEILSLTEDLILGIYLKHSKQTKPNTPSDRKDQALLSLHNLEKLELKNINLSYANCAQVYAEKKDWLNSNLEGSLFVDSILNESIFKNANLNRVDFSRSDMINCDFQGATLKHADFENCNLTGANFKGCIIDDGTSFRNAILENAIFD